jgi:hypothetical protein
MDHPEPPHFNELCRCIGVVVLQAQMLESSLARYLVVSQKLDDQIAHEQAMALLTSLDRSTLGSIRKDISKKAPLPKELDDLLEIIHAERNWMIHRIDREDPKAIANEKAGIKTLRRIQAISTRVNEALQLLDTIGRQLMMAHNFDNEDIQQKAASHSSKRTQDA